MSQSRKKKGFGYYFKIEFSSLQGKITTGFCILGLFAIILMLITASLLKPSINRYEQINEVIYPSHTQIAALQKSISVAINSSEKSYLKNTGRLKREELAKIVEGIQKPLDSLIILSSGWENKSDITSLHLAANKSKSLTELLQEANNKADSSALEAIYSRRLPLLQEEINTSLNTILKNQAALRDNYNQQNAQREANLVWILLLCFLLSFVVGSTIGGFIVMQVLKVIRHLKYKILELSEGTLIAPIPPSKNELNSIGKAVNTLTDNLRNISEFAIEVGKGNFENNKLKFENNGELAKSLFEMQESLKRVAEEERIRKWTAEGLAGFNEYLRVAEDNIDKFATDLISRLSKHLNINQGTIYILNEENEAHPVLELKGCYAYDRQKFITKTIEPGQGLVGQAFLEKEYIYLKNIPNNFMSITSGLGDSTARFLLIIPLKVNTKVNGILELASFTEFPDYKISFIEKLAESISSAISHVHTSQVTSRLLEEAQNMGAEMKVQEEMLRQNSEELMATQEKLEREISQIKDELLLTEAALSQIQFPQIIVNQSYRISWLNPAAENLFRNKLHSLKNTPLQELGIVNSKQTLDEIAFSLSKQENATVTETLIVKHQEFEAHFLSFTAGNKKYYSLTLYSQKVKA